MNHLILIIGRFQKDNRAILIDEALNYGRGNYTQILVSLIKMETNTTLRDVYGKTAIDYIPEDKLKEVYKNLKYALKCWEDKEVGIRTLRTIVKIDVNKKDSKENTIKYFNTLKDFAKNNAKGDTSKHVKKSKFLK